MDWRKRIVVNPEVNHGEPSIRGTRVTVSALVGAVAEGLSYEEITREYPVTVDDVKAALAYAAEVLRDDILLPLTEEDTT
ncbi:MAG: DUF433 domain-containing protein [Deltaproteobacteria bacterium]|nr:DUF433 domain-containing protein [Deltaproteobacteria bacterium]